jgi:hypothetical protein
MSNVFILMLIMDCWLNRKFKDKHKARPIKQEEGNNWSYNISGIKHK